MPLLGGSPEVPCAQCGRRVAGLGWGELCLPCRSARQRRASRMASRISLAAAALMAAYVSYRLPPDPMARVYAAITVLAVYIIVRRIATRLAMEFLPRSERTKEIDS